MKPLTQILVATVALLHIGFLVLEMFFWNHEIGQKIFSLSPEVLASSEIMAKNQGLYNGFLAVGLLWGLFAARRDITLFFLGCMVVAGIFGGITATPAILFVQALPALLAFGFVLSGRRGEK